MKNLFNLVFLLALLPLLSSCNDNHDEDTGMSLAPEKFNILMAVTNNVGEDLVLASENYVTTGDYAKKFRFDTWNAYLGEKLIQSKEEDYMCNYKPVSYNDKTEQYFISLETDGRLQKQMEDWYKRYAARYIVTSPSLFADTKEHVIELEIQGIKDTYFIDFTILVDGIKQEVYYPESWEGLYPKDLHSNATRPYFILNIDMLQLPE